jgi:ADP-ribose pyrophosphatase YjhB (NUDIX family)
MSDISIRNPLVNQEDLKDHDAVSAVFHRWDDDRILIFHHVKYQFWTIPVGKILANQDAESTLRQEVVEELSVVPIEFKLIGKFTRAYDRGEGIVTQVTQHVYDILKYDGILKNNEPHKHDEMIWLLPSTLKTMKTSDATKFALGLIQ